MKTMHTLISYDFYYQHGEPVFCSMSVAVFENNEIVHHHCVTSSDSIEIAAMAEKAEGWPLVYESVEDEEGYSSRHYTKTFGAS
jgi:hypothetical protein